MVSEVNLPGCTFDFLPVALSTADMEKSFSLPCINLSDACYCLLCPTLLRLTCPISCPPSLTTCFRYMDGFWPCFWPSLQTTEKTEIDCSIPMQSQRCQNSRLQQKILFCRWYLSGKKKKKKKKSTICVILAPKYRETWWTTTYPICWQCQSLEADNPPALFSLWCCGLACARAHLPSGVGHALLVILPWKSFVNWRKIWKYFGKYYRKIMSGLHPHWMSALTSVTSQLMLINLKLILLTGTQEFSFQNFCSGDSQQAILCSGPQRWKWRTATWYL